jgi:glucose/arabinose dehydrogenase
MSRPSRSIRLVLAVLVAVTVLAACSSDDGNETATTTTAGGSTDGADATTTTAAPPSEGTLDRVELATQQIAELDTPIALAARPGSSDLYIAEKRGTVRLVKVTSSSGGTPRYQAQTTPVLDISGDVINSGEQGLLGIAFSNDGRYLYVDYTAQPDGRTVVLEYLVGDRTTVDASSRRQLLEVAQPYANHNGGNVVVGPDGYLYVGLGDGGSGGDPHGNGQNASEPLGSILRIDPVGGDEDEPYLVPPGNPFADGDEGAPEVWLYGVRNPWRFSFDPLTGDLWVADVGQDDWEEIDRLPATGGFDAGRGANLGWNAMEGTHPFEGENPPGAVLPIYEYSHEDGCSITGGYVYRGTAIRELVGAYLFADYCAPGVRAIQVDGDSVIDERTWDLPVEQVQSFGEDADGELYVLLESGPVLKLVPPTGRSTSTTARG